MSRAQPLDAEAIVERNKDAVVTLFGERDGDPRAIQGSGCVVDASGIVLTVAHAVIAAERITAYFNDGTERPLQLLAADKSRDLALLRMPEPAGVAVTVGDAGMLKAGAPIVTISAPKGLYASVSSGIIASLDRAYNGRPMLQTDLDLNPGSSGGPVFDRNGRLIGVIAARVEDVNEATLVSPINEAYSLLRKNGVAIPPPGMLVPFAAIEPGESASDEERAAIAAFNEGVSARTPREKVAHYEEAVRLSAGFFEAWFNLGVAYTAAGQEGKAVAAYKHARAIQPDSAAVLRNLGRVLLQQNRLEEVLRCFEKAVDVAPNDAGVHNDLGEAYRRMGRLDMAHKSFSKALELRPEYPAARYNLGLTCVSQERWSEAIASFRAYLNLCPDAPDAEKVKGWIAKIEQKGQ